MPRCSGCRLVYQGPPKCELCALGYKFWYDFYSRRFRWSAPRIRDRGGKNHGAATTQRKARDAALAHYRVELDTS